MTSTHPAGPAHPRVGVGAGGLRCLMQLLLLALLHAQTLVAAQHPLGPPEEISIALAGEKHRLAAKELRRVVYAATGRLPAIGGLELLREGEGEGEGEGPASEPGTVLVLGRLDQLGGELRGALGPIAADPEAHLVWSAATTPRHLIVLGGSTDGAVLHAAYTAAERLFGARFLLSGDVIPRLPRGHRLAVARHALSPRFASRGLQPFHDFAVGPDWWSLDDFKMVLAQQRRMKQNFIGFHSYPFAGGSSMARVSASGDPLAGKAEPLAWVGRASDLNADGSVKASGAYPAFWRTTGDDGWGLAPRNTSSYVAGASLLFPRDCYGSPAQEGVCVPESPDEAAAVINAAATLFGSALDFARSLGITSAIGTQVPLQKPPGLTSEEAWEGMFTRIDKLIKPDIYWHWTSEACRIVMLSRFTALSVSLTHHSCRRAARHPRRPREFLDDAADHRRHQCLGISAAQDQCIVRSGHVRLGGRPER